MDGKSETTELLAHIGRTPQWQRDLIGDAVAEANPDIEGDLMRCLDARGVGRIIRDGMKIVRNGRRSRYVQGWRPE